MADLRESLSAGDSGHIDDHQVLHTFRNATPVGEFTPPFTIVNDGSGTVANTHINRHPVLTMGNGDMIGLRWQPPAGVETVSFVIEWTNLGAGSGTVGHRMRMQEAGAGETLSQMDVLDQIYADTLSAPAENVVSVDTLLSGHAVTPEEIYDINFFRSGDGDLTNNSGLLRLVILRAS